MEAKAYLDAQEVEAVLTRAIAEVIKERPANAIHRISHLLAEKAPLRMRQMRAFYHPSEVGMGQKGEMYEQTVDAVKRYASALSKGKEDNYASLFALWGADGEISWEDPAGSPPRVTRAQFRDFLDRLPSLSLHVELCKVAADELQAAAVVALSVGGKPAAKLIDTFEFDSSGKLKKIKVFFHPSELGLGEKNDSLLKAEAAVAAHAEGLSQGHDGRFESWLKLWGEDHAIDLEDPVGAPRRSTRTEIQSFFLQLPPLKLKVKLCKIAAGERQAAAHIEISPDGAPTLQVIDVFEYV